ncbi:hypothetical protein HBI56_104630 [Parastagonospora nodorum]|uniref:Ankyrin n=2 Tax=Phaeosphaeria nodorum (strain SN15 / ATCC MYA-4574 / FGSC 10173) TaxID=321614 RepID=A0A7U2FCG3_PHANO|nr:hypothetical protein SNOG_11418 [Parastagonospora nodorum SN15]KAH3911389.1 hypothetical protein HBH56_134280 [Parastagonospora nodorum]EAT81126.1 hypothetical protein SNOG_11418 [Parastagonospora nodorum SN15]KAH3926915.1 hypothetical protein HBH54_159010 [Parastagonospora nodorum]KAH3949520.1 hypothetical protein HBH53_089340 [Parastagonospora nodorum]KAH3958914.1 hypothetical protein HBH51_204490 [Parastagonospora nodorum]
MQIDVHELMWDKTATDFYFLGPLTKSRDLVQAPALASLPSEPNQTSTVSSLPTQAQKKTALEIALSHGYCRVIAQLLEYGIDLNTEISSMTSEPRPLEWAIEHQDIDMLRLFLAKTTPKLDRIAGTRMLGQAVDTRNTAIVKAVLDHSICCDFEDTDRPFPRPANCTDWFLFELSDHDGSLGSLSPLVGAVKHGDIEIVRLLLGHGANSNVAYHDYPQQMAISREGGAVGFSCGRAVQLGMELGRFDIVRVLRSNGADIGLERPVWDVRDHRCEAVPREVWQRVVWGCGD